MAILTAGRPGIPASRRPELGIAQLLGEHAACFHGATAPRDALLIHGDPERFAPLRRLPQLRSAEHLLESWDGSGRVKAWAPPHLPPAELLPASGAEARELYERGACLVLQRVESFVPGLRSVLRHLERELGIPVGSAYAEAFCARAGSGARPHFDHTATFNCQLEGSKTWWVAANPAVRFPPQGLFLGDAPPPELAAVLESPLPTEMPSDARQLSAQPGSVMFVPPGVLHATRTEATSFALLFTLDSETVAERVAQRTRAALLGLESLRAPRLEQRDHARSAGRVAARALRQLARSLLEQGVEPGPGEEEHLALHPRYRLEILQDGRLSLHSGDQHRLLQPSAQLACILAWISEQTHPFTLYDLAESLPHLPPEMLRPALRQLLDHGLLTASTPLADAAQ